MGKENAKLLLEKIKQNKTLVDRLRDAGESGFSSLSSELGAPCDLDSFKETVLDACQSDAGKSRELTAKELELISAGPTAVEYAVMLSLIIVVC